MAEGKMIEYRVDNGVAVLEINRPPVNSYTTELLKELDAAVLDARFDDNVHAIEFCATEKTIVLKEALELGLVHYIYDRKKFMEQVMDYARQFIVPNKSSLAVGKVKRAIQTGFELSLPDGLALERELLAQTFGSEDGQEGVKAYLEKRTAQFKGK